MNLAPNQTSNSQTRKWLPQTKEGSRALVLGIAAIIWLFSASYVPTPFATLTEIILVFFAVRFVIKAVFEKKDRSVLTIVVFILLCIVAGFWIMFALGELLFPH